MSIKQKIKKVIPIFGVEERLISKISELQDQIRDLDMKNELLFWLTNISEGNTEYGSRKRIFKSIPKAEGKLRLIQLGSNSLLQKLREICDECDLSFFLIGGTLIGATRHDGFIPWDDDIDVGMMREDFNKLKEAISSHPELCIDYYYKRDGGFRVPKLKYRECDLFWVDFFLFDYIYSDDIERDWKNHLYNCFAFRDTIVKEEIENKNIPNGGINYRNPELDRVLEKTLETIAESDLYINKMGKKYLVDSVCTPYWETEMTGYYLADNCLPLIKNGASFEGKTYAVWKNFDMYLQQSYGNIWCFPSKIRQMHEKELSDFSVEDLIFIEKKGIAERGE